MEQNHENPSGAPNEWQDLLAFKKTLNQISPSFCLAKWLQVTIHLQNGQTHSCHHPPTHIVPMEELKKNPTALHNTEYKKRQRKKMLEGERPPECQYCWNIEDAPGEHMSDRQLKSYQTWAKPHLDHVLRSGATQDINPKYVEISFGYECNFKCSYCAPHISSSIMAEMKKYGRYDTGDDGHDLEWLDEEGLTPIKEEENPYVKAFWDWWPSLYPDLEVFRITGGEPLINRNTFRVLDYINNHPRPDLELAINSNLGMDQEYIDRFIQKIRPICLEKKVKSFFLFTSIDSYGKQAEYIRHGLHYETFLKHLDHVLVSIPELTVTIMCTFNALSVPSFSLLLRQFLELRKKYGKTNDGRERLILDISYLHWPSYQSVKVLPVHFFTDIEQLAQFMEENSKAAGDNGTGFLIQEIERMRRIVDWTKTPTDPHWLEKARASFYRFFSEHDRRRKTDFVQTFPEFKYFWKLCEQASQREHEVTAHGE